MVNQQPHIEYKEPEPLNPGAGEPTPYPIDALPPILANAIKAIADFVQVPTALAGQCVIDATAHLAMAKVDAWSHRTYKQACSLNSLTLGRSGEGKSSAYGIAFKPILKHDREQKKDYRQRQEEREAMCSTLEGKALRAYQAANPPPVDGSSIVSSDATFGRLMARFVDGAPYLSWSTDEGGQMLGSYNMKGDTMAATLGALTKLWDDGHGERVRARGNEDGSGVFYNRRFALSLMAQERTIREDLNDPIKQQQGFLPRFLLAAPASTVGTRLITLERLKRKAEDEPAIVALWERQREILALPDALTGSEIEAEPLMPDGEARAAWMEFYNEVEGQQSRYGSYSNMTPFASRAAQQAQRLSAVIAYFEGKQQVDLATMKAAIALADYSLKEWARYLIAAKVDAETQDAIDMIDWLVDRIKNKDQEQWREFTRTDYSQRGHMRNQAQRRDAAIAILLDKEHLFSNSDSKTLAVNPWHLRP